MSNRLENKIDKIYDSVTEIKIEQSKMRSDQKRTDESLKVHHSEVSEIKCKLDPIFEEYEFKRRKREEAKKKAKNFALYAVYITIPVGIVVGIARILG